MIKYPHPSRVNYTDYLNSYPDLQHAFGSNIAAAKRHWQTTGRFEGRHVMLTDVDYKKINNYILNNHHSLNTSSKVNVLTCMYHDTNSSRMYEYQLALQLNLQNPNVEHIHVMWDVQTGPSEHLIESHDKLTVLPCIGRPSFQSLFEYCNNCKDKSLWCVSNGDIVLTNDIDKLKAINLSNKLLALTRWEFVSEDDISIFHEHERPNKYSQDTWWFETPVLIPSELQLIHVGELLCDSKLSEIYKHYQHPIFNPCIDIKTLHMHMQNARTQTYNTSHPGHVECCSLLDIY